MSSMKRRTGIRSMSEKRKQSGVRTRHNSTIALPAVHSILPTVSERFAGADRSKATRIDRIERRAPPRKQNPERQRKSAKRYQALLALYRKSPTHAVVEARCNARCEFAVLEQPMHDGESRYAVLDVAIDAALPLGYRRCGRRRRSHHHRTYARLGGNELPEDMLAGCTGCHEYVEATKLVHRKIPTL